MNSTFFSFEISGLKTLIQLTIVQFKLSIGDVHKSEIVHPEPNSAEQVSCILGVVQAAEFSKVDIKDGVLFTLFAQGLWNVLQE